MIQDIYPSRLDNSFTKCEPNADDVVFVFDDEGRVLANMDGGKLCFTSSSEVGACQCVYLFSVDDKRYFLKCGKEYVDIPGYESFPIRQLRDSTSGKELFAAFTGYHLWKWYSDNRYCGVCAHELIPDEKERALRCCKCGNIIYPRINPAVIVGVTNGDSILITRYKRGYAHNALIAGFAEIGETLEQTVEREVMEEAGLKVTNIRYYKSQPWGMAQDLLVGFYCDVSGDTTVKMDNEELKYAQFTKREDIELQPGSASLTNEMMRMFKENKI